EANHWMESINDAGAYVWDTATIKQPFDFSGRTGVIAFDVDAKTGGGHEWWPEVQIDDQPISSNEGAGGQPRNGVLINFGDTSGQTAGKTPTDTSTGVSGISGIHVF